MKRDAQFMRKQFIATGICATLTLAVFAPTGLAQSGSLGGTTALRTQDGQPVPVSQVSLTYQAPARQKTYQIGDIIYVDVKDKFEYGNNADNQRKKKVETTAEITSFAKITGLFKWPVKADPEILPSIGGKLDHKTQNQGKLRRTETITFRIPCEVTDIRDNGNLVIEGTREAQIGEEGNIRFVSGIIRPDDIKPDHSIEGGKVAGIKINDIPSGNVYDTARRPWGTRLIEQFKPF